MNNLAYINNDPILMELDSSVDKDSAMKMIAFKYFNSDMNLLEDYLQDIQYKPLDSHFEFKKIEPKTQLEFLF